MDKAVLVLDLAEAERLVLSGELRLASQRDLIHKLERAGNDKTQAETVLGALIATQQLHLTERARLRNLLLR
jgi:hypothetical protein